jgi:hypothetical protein
MTKQETSDQMIRRIRKKQLKEMEGMTEKERSAYFKSKYEQGKERVRALRQKDSPRDAQVLIRLTEDERRWLEGEAQKSNSTVSAWIRDRVLGKQSPMDSVTERLDRIESLLKKQSRLKATK